MKRCAVTCISAALLMCACTASGESKSGTESSRKLRVAACQILTGPDMKANTAIILDWIEQAAKQDVDVVSFPEACLPGYLQDRDHYEKLGKEAVESAEAEIIAASKRLNIAVVVGTVTWEKDDIYNSVLAIDKGGVVRGRYSKTYLAEQWPHPGKSLPVLELAGVKSCFIICHDVRYPELVRLPAIEGAQICFFCSHESGLTQEYKLSAYRAMPISRATENTIFLVMANSAANPADNTGSHGNSKIIDPDGNVVEEAGYFEERLVVADIDIAKASRTIAEKSVQQEKTFLTRWLKKGAEQFTTK